MTERNFPSQTKFRNIVCFPAHGTQYQPFSISGVSTYYSLLILPPIDVYTFNVDSHFVGNPNVLNVLIPLQRAQINTESITNVDARISFDPNTHKYTLQIHFRNTIQE
ncbi:hypothetical protein PPL_00569 [Heterostelium album PN500]|uniref:Uncharacterized protein n=1 Tax=Heterostelium pallidum (strain ATCC 26659 / Pp 5 / PN500) TaxID=670386 RepID=D3AWU1_HETP5|nr:hypothetical protein PPL_00569 [Heterostelium album PN500]EFA86764.1 hypothetical protein PPL_00569 [Heterostelium album PN500]|eukprot:XP_020438868.1 hypothetical protein PPL_00569 [Heterostelium album PN500]